MHYLIANISIYHSSTFLFLFILFFGIFDIIFLRNLILITFRLIEHCSISFTDYMLVFFRSCTYYFAILILVIFALISLFLLFFIMSLMFSFFPYYFFAIITFNLFLFFTLLFNYVWLLGILNLVSTFVKT